MPYIGNQHNVGDHVNNFKVLDDISSHTATFDGSATSVVDTTNNTIRVPLHRFVQGQRVTYTNGGGGNIGGLTTGTAYFVSFDSANTIKLATSLANANSNTVINLSAVGSGSSHTLNVAFDGVNTKFKVTYSNGKAARFNNATQLNVAINNVIQRPNIHASTFTEGFAIEDSHKIVFKVAPTVNDIFWGSIIANTIENFDLRDNEVDNFTGDGSTTEFTLSTIPANNESIIVSINGVVQHPSDKNTARSYTLIDSIIQFTAAPALNDEIQVRHIGFAGATTTDVSGFYGRTGNVALTSSDHITTGDITSRNVNASGIVTASTFDGAFTGNVVGTSATFTGNLTVGGVLTYEDVTNVDSVGIITAQKDIHVGAGISAVGIITGQFLMASGGSDANKQNVKIGWMNSENLSTGGYNVIVGRRAGENINTGSNNVILGANAGYSLTDQSGGVFIGNNAGNLATKTNNIYIGAEVARYVTSAENNVIIGTYAGIDNQGNGNTLVGYYAGRGASGATTGHSNTFIGSQVGMPIRGGINNTGVGFNALRFIQNGSYNTALGDRAGEALLHGNSNVFIGKDTGKLVTSGSNNIVIGSSAQASSATVSNEITFGSNGITKFRIPGIGVTFSTSGNHISNNTTFNNDVDITGTLDVSDVVGITSSLNVTGITSFSASNAPQPFTVIGGSHPTASYNHRQQFVFKTSHGHTDLKFENSYGGNWYSQSVSHTRILWEAYGERNASVPGGDYGRLGEFCSIQPLNSTPGAFNSLIFKGNDGVAGLSTMCRMYPDRQHFFVHGNNTASIDQVGLGITGNIYHIGDYTSNYSNIDTYFGFPGNNAFHLVTSDTRKLYIAGTYMQLENMSNGVIVNSDVHLSEYIKHKDDSNTYFGFPANDTITFNTNNVERLRITSDGKVGIGEDAPQQKLHLHEDSSNGNFMVFTNSTTGVTGNDGCLFGINSDEGGTIWNQENGYIRFGTNDTERLKITNSGDIYSSGLNTFEFNGGWSAEGRNVVIWPCDDAGNWFSFVGTNLRFTDGGNFVKPSDNSNSNWGNIAGLVFEGVNQNNNNGNYPAIRFVVDQPGGNGANYSLGSGSSGRTAAIDNNTVMSISGNGEVGIGEDNPDGNALLIRAASTVGTNKGHIMLTGDSATVGQGPQIVFSESGATTSYAGGYVGFLRTGGNSVGDLVFGTRGTSGNANTAPTERLRLTSTGRLGINNGNPQYLMHAKHNGQGGNERIDLHMTNDTTGHSITDGVQFGYQNTAGAYIWNFENTDIYFGSNNVVRLYIKSSTGHLEPGADNAQNLGSSSKRWANIYTGDLQLSNVTPTSNGGEPVGSGGNEVDGTEGTWTIQEGANDLFIINRVNGKKYKFNLTEVS